MLQNVVVFKQSLIQIRLFAGVCVCVLVAVFLL